MAQEDLQSPADDARPLDTLDDAAAALSAQFGEDDDVPAGDDPDEEIDPQEDAEQGDDDADEPDDEQDDEPVKPAIEPPASLNAEAKAVFAQLPEEAQRVWADTESTRNRQVTEATTRAAEAQRSAQADAARQTAEAQQLFAQQVRTLANAYAPAQPNPADYGDNMQAYARDHANWQFAATQHDALMQQVTGLDTQARQAIDAQQGQWAQEEARALRSALPDWFDEAKGPELKAKLTAVGAELGYDESAMSQAGASDIKALNKALGWKSKAEKWDALQARRMQPVRAAKTAKPGSAQPQGSVRAQRASEATTRLKSTGSLDDAAAALSGIFSRR